MKFDPGEMDMQAVYKLLTGLVVPRPIGWASTRSPEGVDNLAPFSFFIAITPSPPHVAISVGQREGQMKDTLRNVRHTGDFVINTVSSEVVEQMNTTSGDWPPDSSEFAVSGLTPVPSDVVTPARVAEAPASMECLVRQIVPVGGPPYGAHLIIGEVVRFHVRDDLVLERGRIDQRRLQAVGRLAGAGYCSTDDQFELERPQVGEARSLGGQR
ncbi:MAG: flavin reductase family protein [Chloroflexota bacterium]|nr:flavin reductase family protein [Chloroflexota bacterium]